MQRGLMRLVFLAPLGNESEEVGDLIGQLDTAGVRVLGNLATPRRQIGLLTTILFRLACVLPKTSGIHINSFQQYHLLLQKLSPGFRMFPSLRTYTLGVLFLTWAVVQALIH